MKNYYITTDMESMEIDAENIEQALAEFEAPEWVKTADDFETWINGIGGFGEIYEDDIRIAEIKK